MAHSDPTIKASNPTSDGGATVGDEVTYTEGGLWLVISRPRSLTVLDAQTRVPIADLPLDTEAPTDAFTVAAGQEHQLLVGTRRVLASIEMDPEQWKSAACQVAARKLTRVEFTKAEWARFLTTIP